MMDQEAILSPKQEGRGDPQPPGYISPQSHHPSSEGQGSGDSSKQFMQREVHKGASQD